MTPGSSRRGGGVLRRRVVLFTPVKEEVFGKWEYYLCEKHLLERSYEEVLVRNTYRGALAALRGDADLFCWWWHRSAPLVAAARLLGKRVFCTGALHMFDQSGADDYYSNSLAWRFLSRFSLRHATANLFISEDQRQSITSHLKVREPVVIHSSLLPEKGALEEEAVIARHEGPRAARGGRSQFLFFAWLTRKQLRRKGLYPLLDAFAGLPARGEGSPLLVVAGKAGDAVEDIRSYVRAHSLEERVSLRLDVSGEEKEALYHASDLLVTPSYMEGFGNASLEAMGYGLPAVVSRFGASHEVVGDTGFIVNAIDAPAIGRVLAAYEALGRAERTALRRAAFARAHTVFPFERRLAAFGDFLARMERG